MTRVRSTRVGRVRIIEPERSSKAESNRDPLDSGSQPRSNLL